jgi:hypothetical protein
MGKAWQRRRVLLAAVSGRAGVNGGETVAASFGGLVAARHGSTVPLGIPGAALPESWTKAVCEWDGLGPWPGGALLVYLARALSLLYGFYGLLTLYLSFEVRRYLPWVRFMAVVGFLFAPVMFVVIWTAGLPTVWAVCEPASILVISALWYMAVRPGDCLTVN